MHRELQGTRIQRGSRATAPHRQDSDYNKCLQLELHDVCRGWEKRGRENDKQREKRPGRWEMRAEETNQMDVAVKVKVWEGEK